VSPRYTVVRYHFHFLCYAKRMFVSTSTHELSYRKKKYSEQKKLSLFGFWKGNVGVFFKGICYKHVIIVRASKHARGDFFLTCMNEVQSSFLSLRMKKNTEKVFFL